MALTLRRRGKYWHARGSVPMRQADGKIAWVRIEESTREAGRARALRAAQDLADYYRDQAYHRQEKPSPPFTDAALTYVKTVGERRFIAELVAHFGETPIAEIDQAAMANAAHTIYPGRSPSTHLRAVYAPVRTIMRLSGVIPSFKNPKVEKKPPRVAPENWFDAVLPHCNPNLAALLVFITLRGRRITESLRATYNGDGTVTIQRSKTGEPVVVDVPKTCWRYLDKKKAVKGSPLFGYSDRWGVRNAIKAACKKAGVEYYSTHPAGRHAFASRLLKAGRSVKHVAVAGGWKSPRLVLDTYGHLEQSEVASDVKELGDRWGRIRQRAGKRKKNNV